MELPQDRIHILVDIRMIELKIIKNQSLRSVMNKLRALIEERCVVLVSFDDEKSGFSKAG